MSDHDGAVLDGDQSTRKKSKQVDDLKHERELVVAQNTLYFQTIGLKNSKKDQDKVSKSRDNKNKLEKYSKDQQDKQEHEKSELRFQALYEDLLQKFDAGIKTLAQAGPGADSIADDVRRTRTTARQLVKGDQPDYKLACETLQKQDLGKVLQGVPALVKSANGLFETQARKSFAEYNSLKEKLRTAPLSQGVKEDLEQKLLAATAAAKVPATDPGKLDTNCLGRLKTVGTELAKAIKDAETAKSDYDELSRTGTGRTKLQQTAPGNLEEFNDAVSADLGRKRQNARTLYGLMDYPLALASLRSLAQECEEWQQKLEAELIGSYRDWAEQKGALKVAVTEADNLAKSTTAPKELVDQAVGLAGELGELVAAKPKPGRECNEAVDRFETLKIRLGGLTSRASDSVGFGAAKAHACKPNDDKVIEVSTALNNLEQKLTQRKDVDQPLREKALGPLKTRLKDILNEWLDRKLKAFDFASLDAQTIADELKALAADIADTADDDEIATLAKSPELERAQSELRTAMDEAMKVQLKIMSFNPEEGLANREFLTQVSQMLATSDDPSLLDSVRDQLLAEISRQKGLVVFADKRIESLRATIDENLKPVPSQLTEQGTLIGKLRGGDTRKAFEAMQGTLQTEYDSVVAMSVSDQISVLEQAVADAEELALEVNNFLLELKRKPVDDPHEPTGVKEIKDLLLFLEKMLNDSKTAQEYMVVTYSGIEERLQLALENLGSSTMAAMTKELRAIRTDIDRMGDEAETAKERYKGEQGFQIEVKAIEKQLGDKAFTENAPAYVKKAKADLETLKKNAKFEGGYDGATADAVKMKIELGKMLASGKNARDIPVLIFEKETAIAGENAKEELQKTKWEAELEIVKNDLDASKSINPKEIKGLKSLVRDAKKAVEKSHDYGMGRSQLEQIRTKLALLQQNPGGLAIASRNQLPGVNALYRKAVMEFGKTLTDLEKNVSAKLEEADRGAFAKQVVEVRTLLNPALFTAYIRTITTAEDDGKRSTAREKALRGARQMMTYVKSDYRMRELARAPASVDQKMAGVVSKVFLALLNLENNLLVSL